MSKRVLTYYTLDVFAENKFQGNQLAVFIGSKDLSSEEMQSIAQEMNYSETTFILHDSKQDQGYDVRIFTPVSELPFAGHPTLGTAYIIDYLYGKNNDNKIVLNLKAGKIPVQSSSDQVHWMKQNRPEFGKTISSERIASVINVDQSDINSSFPVQEVSTGLPFIIVPLKSMEAIKSAKMNYDRYFDLIKDLDAKMLYLFTPDSEDAGNDIHARMFGAPDDIPEDPATGSACGTLAAYLIKHRFFYKDRIELKVEQGYEINRPSLLYLKAGQEEDHIAVEIGGKVHLVSKGELYLGTSCTES